MGRTDGQKRYLERHQGLWRCVVAVPRHLVPALGPRLKRSLGTGSLREANLKKWPIVAEFKSIIANATAPSLTGEADAWRVALAAGDGSPDDPTPILLHDHLDAIRGDPIATEADERGSPVYIYDPARERQATAFADRAYGRATPLTEHLSAFLSSRGQLKQDTRARHEAALLALASWLKGEVGPDGRGLPSTIQAIDRRTAIRYVDQLPPGRPDPERLSLQWEWMAQREMVAADPWTGLKAAKRAPVAPERAFTNDEVAALLRHPHSEEMDRLMKVALLTGARLDAVIRAKIGPETITFPPMKKERQERTIPLHPLLRQMDLTNWPPYTTSEKASKAFTSHRRATFGPDDGTRRRAIINMHSARRWTITALERNAIDERVISDIVGHDRKSMTGRYSSGSTLETMRGAIEGLRLPT